MEKTQDGFDLQLEVLASMLGITTPDLRNQAKNLLRKALESNPKSAINDSTFFGRLKKLLFKPVPRKTKRPDRNASTSDTPVTPPIARGVQPVPVTPTIARGTSNTASCWYDPFKNGKYTYRDEDEVFQDPSTAAVPYREDIITPAKYGTYNSRGQRFDEYGDIVRDERVYMCEAALAGYTDGTPHITDTYDLYALVQSIDLSCVPAAIHQLLSTGIYAPHTDLQPRRSEPVEEPKPSNSDPPLIPVMSIDANGSHPDQEGTSTLPSTDATVSTKRNLIAHYIRTIALPPLVEGEFLTAKQIRKTRIDRGKQEKARLRQLKTFLTALTN